MGKEETQVIIYHDEEKEDFSVKGIKTRKIDEHYKYKRRNPFSIIFSFIIYRLIMFPASLIFRKVHFHSHIYNRKILKGFQNKSYIMYANHTQPFGDAVTPTFVAFPSDVYVIVHANNVSMKFQGRLNPYLGAIPLPDTLKAVRNFDSYLDFLIKKHKKICIYPERNLWPCCNFIRKFDPNSFRYQIKYDLPAFCFTNVYKRRGHSNKYNLLTYLDGPFYPNKELNDPMKIREDLNDRISKAMILRSETSDIAPIIYRKAEEETL